MVQNDRLVEALVLFGIVIAEEHLKLEGLLELARVFVLTSISDGF